MRGTNSRAPRRSGEQTIHKHVLVHAPGTPARSPAPRAARQPGGVGAAADAAAVQPGERAPAWAPRRRACTAPHGSRGGRGSRGEHLPPSPSAMGGAAPDRSRARRSHPGPRMASRRSGGRPSPQPAVVEPPQDGSAASALPPASPAHTGWTCPAQWTARRSPPPSPRTGAGRRPSRQVALVGGQEAQAAAHGQRLSRAGLQAEGVAVGSRSAWPCASRGSRRSAGPARRERDSAWRRPLFPERHRVKPPLSDLARLQVKALVVASPMEKVLRGGTPSRMTVERAAPCPWRAAGRRYCRGGRPDPGPHPRRGCSRCSPRAPSRRRLQKGWRCPPPTGPPGGAQ